MKPPPTALAQPRGFLGIALRIGALAFLPFALFMSWLVSTVFGLEFGQVLPFGLCGGIVFSSVFGLSNARFLQVETLTLEVADVRDFLARVNVATSQLGFYPAAQCGDFHTYAPSFQTGWAAGHVSVQLAAGQATLVGPRVFVQQIVERIRGSGAA